MPHLAYRQRKGSSKVYVNVHKSVYEDGRIRTIYLAYIGELHAPDFPKRLRKAERKYGPLRLKPPRKRPTRRRRRT